jgi:hypothetical protein
MRGDGVGDESLNQLQKPILVAAREMLHAAALGGKGVLGTQSQRSLRVSELPTFDADKLAISIP